MRVRCASRRRRCSRNTFAECRSSTCDKSTWLGFTDRSRVSRRLDEGDALSFRSRRCIARLPRFARRKRDCGRVARRRRSATVWIAEARRAARWSPVGSTCRLGSRTIDRYARDRDRTRSACGSRRASRCRRVDRRESRLEPGSIELASVRHRGARTRRRRDCRRPRRSAADRSAGSALACRLLASERDADRQRALPRTTRTSGVVRSYCVPTTQRVTRRCRRANDVRAIAGANRIRGRGRCRAG